MEALNSARVLCGAVGRLFGEKPTLSRRYSQEESRAKRETLTSMIS
jgi:hypothetical protein